MVGRVNSLQLRLPQPKVETTLLLSAEISYAMPRPLPDVQLEAGKVYRTAALRRWGSNPTRLAQRLEALGVLQRLGHGLVYAPRKSRFGVVPPSNSALLDAFLDGTPYVVTGPARWNALGLGSTALFAHPLVYNTKRTGTLCVGGRTFAFRRTAFPTSPTPEWFAVDLLRHADAAGVDVQEVTSRLARKVAEGALDVDGLFEMAARFGGPDEVERVAAATRPAAA
jgi:hypothetical protein